MKSLLLICLTLVSAISFAAGNDTCIDKRNATNTNTSCVNIPVPATDGIYFYDKTDFNPKLATLGSGITLTSGVLSSSGSTTDWATLTGKPGWTATFDGSYPSLTSKPTLFDGTYASLTGKPTLFNGAYGSLTGIPSTFTPATHTHVISDITSLQAALDSKISTPSCGAATRTIGTAYQISTTKFTDVSYSIDVSANVVLLAGVQGTAFLEYADNVGMSTNVVTVTSGTSGTAGVIGITNVGSIALVGKIPAGKYARVRTVNTTGTPTYSLRSGQECQS